jgi:hypothetical protein
LNSITAAAVEKTMVERKEITMTPVAQTVDEDLVRYPTVCFV